MLTPAPARRIAPHRSRPPLMWIRPRRRHHTWIRPAAAPCHPTPGFGYGADPEHHAHHRPGANVLLVLHRRHLTLPALHRCSPTVVAFHPNHVARLQMLDEGGLDLQLQEVLTCICRSMAHPGERR